MLHGNLKHKHINTFIIQVLYSDVKYVTYAIKSLVYAPKFKTVAQIIANTVFIHQ
jgi:hypothetical protein